MNKSTAARPAFFLPVLCAFFLTAGLAFLASVARGADSDSTSASAPPGLAQARDAVAAGDYSRAIIELEALLRQRPDDADVLNLMGYSQRKAGHAEQALAFYTKALEIEPKHRGANEYLGQLYLEMGKLELARERLAVLDRACFFGCDEYTELKQAIEAHVQKQSASK